MTDYERGQRDAWEKVALLRDKYAAQACDHAIPTHVADRSVCYAAALDEALIEAGLNRFAPDSDGGS